MSQVWEYIKIALMNIKGNKGRSILTMLGIIIGISSVIMIISIGNGVKAEINGELEAMAGGQLYLAVNNAGKSEKSLITLNDDDFEAIRDKVDHVIGVTPNYSMWGSTVKGRRGAFDANVQAGTESQEFVSKDPIIAGHYFTAADYSSARKVCVVTESTAKQLFGTTNILGMTVEVTVYNVTQELTIVGIRKDAAGGLMSAMNGGTMSQIEMPISVLGDSYGFWVRDFEGCYIIGEGSEYSAQIAQDAIHLMEGRKNVRGENAFEIQNFNDQMGQINSVLNSLTIFIVFVAAISLLVGGIGVMNIMLVSVTERTREIGIRKALGARTKSIMVQFLSESAIITLVGGLIGILIGVIGAFAICGALGFPAQVHATTVLGASIFSSAVGIFFGLYPAKKAAKLSPIEALRHE
ncbi:MAG: ABC transporter permease [Lachnospiraceae bacterium]